MDQVIPLTSIPPILTHNSSRKKIRRNTVMLPLPILTSKKYNLTGWPQLLVLVPTESSVASVTFETVKRKNSQLSLNLNWTTCQWCRDLSPLSRRKGFTRLFSTKIIIREEVLSNLNNCCLTRSSQAINSDKPWLVALGPTNHQKTGQLATKAKKVDRHLTIKESMLFKKDSDQSKSIENNG